MSRRERTTGSGGAGAHRADGWKVVFLPGEIELELVGVIDGGDGLPGAEAIESILLDAGEDLLALVRDLGSRPLGADDALELCFESAAVPGDAPVH